MERAGDKYKTSTTNTTQLVRGNRSKPGVREQLWSTLERLQTKSPRDEMQHTIGWGICTGQTSWFVQVLCRVC